ncbi:recombinase family protein [Thalassobium sp. R2A62]|uniref:recombinase family protein n=1 Tax=Thalassobium sp. R2A62 TaxID=633131 RepID=UPI0005947FF2|nr:recombinase family protein [Thalassobium sp. R2A62]
MKQFIKYYRVSTRSQADSGLGLSAQQRDIDLYLSTYAETPWEVLAEFTDVQSGKDDNRPELLKAMALAEETGATILIAKLDRISRRVSFISAIMERKKLNLTIATMPNADKFQLHIYAALAEQEREFISLRTKQALAPLKGTGKLGGNRGNIDRANEAARALADSHAAKVMDTVLPLKEAGRTLQQIADTLNKSGVKTARGGKWHPTTVKNVLARSE